MFLVFKLDYLESVPQIHQNIFHRYRPPDALGCTKGTSLWTGIKCAIV